MSRSARAYGLSLIDDFHALLFASGKLTIAGITKLYSLTKRELDYHIAYTILNRAVKAGTVKKFTQNDREYYQLSNQAKKQLLKIDQWFGTAKAGQWNIIVFDIPEDKAEKRNILRDYLKSLGFIQLQKSVWITNKIFKKADFAIIDELNIKPYVMIFSTQQIAGWLGKDHLKKIFQLDDLNKRFGQLEQELVELIRHWQAAKLVDDKGKKIAWEFIYRMELAKYYRLCKLDPQLPKELLPSPWFRFRVEKLLQKLKSNLEF